MEILVWLLPSGVVLIVMMAWAAVAGRPQREHTDRSEAAYERFAKAIEREHPGANRPRPAVMRDRSNGIAVRPSRSGAASASGDDPGRSASALARELRPG
jgi:hypothetical protein